MEAFLKKTENLLITRVFLNAMSGSHKYYRLSVIARNISDGVIPYDFDIASLRSQ